MKLAEGQSITPICHCFADIDFAPTVFLYLSQEAEDAAQGVFMASASRQPSYSKASPEYLSALRDLQIKIARKTEHVLSMAEVAATSRKQQEDSAKAAAALQEEAQQMTRDLQKQMAEATAAMNKQVTDAVAALNKQREDVQQALVVRQQEERNREHQRQQAMFSTMQAMAAYRHQCQAQQTLQLQSYGGMSYCQPRYQHVPQCTVEEVDDGPCRNARGGREAGGKRCQGWAESKGRQCLNDAQAGRRYCHCHP